MGVQSLGIYTIIKGRSKRFQPSLKGRSARQTASTRVEELSIRYMRPFRTSLTDFYSYGTTVHMSILSSRFMRRVHIMQSSRLSRATGSQCHAAHSIDPCLVRGVGNDKASNHDDPWRTARMRSAARWVANRHESHARRRVTRSSIHLVSTLSTAAHAHLAQPTDDTHRAKALAKQQQDAKLMQPPFASTRAE